MFEPLTDPPDAQTYYGFDVETVVDDQGRHTFLCCALYNEEHGYKRIFRHPEQCLKEMIRLKKSNGCHFVATNLHFDIFELFKSLEERRYLIPVFRKSRLLYARYPYTQDVQRKGKYRYMIFVDTMNFLPMGVEALGEKFLKIPKLPKPSFLGKKPTTVMEWAELERYNMRDAEISQKTMQQIHHILYHFEATCEKYDVIIPPHTPFIHGSKIKYTAAATALDNFRRFFMTRSYHVPPEGMLDEMFQAYYGGRCESFARGTFHSTPKKQIICYDVNSMYPYVMQKYVYPDPDTMKVVEKMSTDDLQYEGVCFAVVDCPLMNIPYLPCKQEEKLLFPCGRFSGWYTTFELRQAQHLGYSIKELGKGYVFTDTIRPFVDYVRVWYALRQRFKQEKNPYEHGAKLLLNSLYGRFALSRAKDRKIIHADDMTLERVRDFEAEGYVVYQPSDSSEWFYVEKEQTNYTEDIVPIWSIYCTAYARHELYQYMHRCGKSLLYVDTDSITTTTSLPSGKQLGDLKIEKVIQTMILIRPKMYAYEDKKETYIKIKGFPLNMSARTLQWFRQLCRTQQGMYRHFTKFCSAQKSTKGLQPNQIQELKKMFSLEDSKRQWKKKFAMNEQEWSTPLVLP